MKELSAMTPDITRRQYLSTCWQLISDDVERLQCQKVRKTQITAARIAPLMSRDSYLPYALLPSAPDTGLTRFRCQHTLMRDATQRYRFIDSISKRVALVACQVPHYRHPRLSTIMREASQEFFLSVDVSTPVSPAPRIKTPRLPAEMLPPCPFPWYD